MSQIVPESRINFRYTAGDVTSAQRTRFLRSSQFKIILFFWLGTTIFLALNVLFPNTFRMVQGAGWPLVLSISLVYVVTMAVLVFVTPLIDFLFNRFWQLPLSLYFSEKQLRLSVDAQAKKSAAKGAKTARPDAKKKPSGDNDAKPARKARSLDLGWNEINQVLVDRRTYILIYGPQSRFFVVPRSAFKTSIQEEQFRSLFRDKLKA